MIPASFACWSEQTIVMLFRMCGIMSLGRLRARTTTVAAAAAAEFQCCNIDRTYLEITLLVVSGYALLQINNHIKQLPSSVPQLLQDVLKRLETDHSATLMNHIMLLLSCSREGDHKFGSLQVYCCTYL